MNIINATEPNQFEHEYKNEDENRKKVDYEKCIDNVSVVNMLRLKRLEKMMEELINNNRILTEKVETLERNEKINADTISNLKSKVKNVSKNSSKDEVKDTMMRYEDVEKVNNIWKKIYGDTEVGSLVSRQDRTIFKPIKFGETRYSDIIKMFKNELSQLKLQDDAKVLEKLNYVVISNNKVVHRSPHNNLGAGYINMVINSSSGFQTLETYCNINPEKWEAPIIIRRTVTQDEIKEVIKRLKDTISFLEKRQEEEFDPDTYVKPEIKPEVEEDQGMNMGFSLWN